MRAGAMDASGENQPWSELVIRVERGGDRLCSREPFESAELTGQRGGFLAQWQVPSELPFLNSKHKTSDVS